MRTIWRDLPLIALLSIGAFAGFMAARTLEARNCVLPAEDATSYSDVPAPPILLDRTALARSQP
jgi:hypothetical protein